MATEKKIERSWKSYLIPLILSTLFLALYGVGVLGFLIIYWHRNRYSLIIKDQSVRVNLGDMVHELSLTELNRVELLQSGIDRKLDIGNLRFTTLEGDTVSFNGVAHPQPLVSTINEAIAVVQQQTLDKNIKPKQPESSSIKTGGLEQMNDLVGLWQQGLIDDEAFEKEKEKFSKE